MGIGAGIKREEDDVSTNDAPIIHSSLHPVPVALDTLQYQSSWWSTDHGGTGNRPINVAGDRKPSPDFEENNSPAFLPLPLQAPYPGNSTIHASHIIPDAAPAFNLLPPPWGFDAAPALDADPPEPSGTVGVQGGYGTPYCRNALLNSKQYVGKNATPSVHSNPGPLLGRYRSPTWNPTAAPSSAWGERTATVHAPDAWEDGPHSSPLPLAYTTISSVFPSWEEGPHSAPASTVHSNPSIMQPAWGTHPTSTTTACVPPVTLKPWAAERTTTGVTPPPPMSSAFRALCVPAISPMHVALPSPSRSKKEEDTNNDVGIGYSQYGEKNRNMMNQMMMSGPWKENIALQAEGGTTNISSEDDGVRCRAAASPPLTKSAAGGSLVATVIGLNGVPLDGHQHPPSMQQPQDLQSPIPHLHRVESPNARHEACSVFPEPPLLSARLREHERNKLFAERKAITYGRVAGGEAAARSGSTWRGNVYGITITPPYPARLRGDGDNDYDYDHDYVDPGMGHTYTLHTGSTQEEHEAKAFCKPQPSSPEPADKHHHMNPKVHNEQKDEVANLPNEQQYQAQDQASSLASNPLEDLRQRIHDELELRAKRKQALEEEKKRALEEEEHINASCGEPGNSLTKTTERWNLSSLLRDLRRGRTDSPPSRTPQGTRTVSKKEPRDTPTKASNSSSSKARIQALSGEEGGHAGEEAGAGAGAEGEASLLSPPASPPSVSVSSSKDPSSSSLAISSSKGPSSPRRIRPLSSATHNDDTNIPPQKRSERRKKKRLSTSIPPQLGVQLGANSSSSQANGTKGSSPLPNGLPSSFPHVPPANASTPHSTRSHSSSLRHSHPRAGETKSGLTTRALPRSLSSDGLLDIRRRHPLPVPVLMDPTTTNTSIQKSSQASLMGSIESNRIESTNVSMLGNPRMPLPAPYPAYVATMNRPIVGLTPREVNRGAVGVHPHQQVLQVPAPAPYATASSEQFNSTQVLQYGIPWSPRSVHTGTGQASTATNATPSLGICAGLEWERWDEESMRGGMRQQQQQLQQRVNRGSDNVQFSLPRASTPPARIFSADARPGIEHRQSMLVPRTVGLEEEA